MQTTARVCLPKGIYAISILDNKGKTIWYKLYKIPPLDVLRGLASGISKRHFISVNQEIQCVSEDLYKYVLGEVVAHMQ
jgi:hypothetical protein